MTQKQIVLNYLRESTQGSYATYTRGVSAWTIESATGVPQPSIRRIVQELKREGTKVLTSYLDGNNVVRYRLA